MILISSAPACAPDPGGPPHRLGPDGAQFAALRAFGADRRRRRRRPERSLSVIDAAMRDVNDAERELALRLEADIASIAARDPGPCRLSAGRLERLEPLLTGRTVAERRLMAMLAYGRADRSRGAGEAAELATRALQGGFLHDDGVGSPALQAAGLTLGLAGHTDAAEELFAGILARAGLTGSFATFSVASAQRGVERYRRGALVDALEDLYAALDAARGQPWETMVDDGRAHLLRVHVERGQIDRAERELRAWSATGPLPETTFGTRILIERGRLRLAQGRFAEAVSDLSSVATRLATRSDSIMFEWRGPAAVAYHQLDRQSEALELAHAELELVRGWGAPRQLGAALGTLGLIEGGEPGIRLLEEAVEVLEGSTARLEHARALVNLGAVLRRTGKPVQARLHLSVGLELAVRSDAGGLAARAREEIDATGATRRRRALLSGPEALTPSEQRVARLAATGLSNPDIARTLFVTRKTVEMHLGSVYRKLEVTSRRQLGSALGLAQTV